MMSKQQKFGMTEDSLKDAFRFEPGASATKNVLGEGPKYF
jgi:hypothetical protein